MTLPADSEVTSRYVTDPQERYYAHIEAVADYYANERDEFRRTVEQEMADRAEAERDRIEWEAGR